MSVKHLENGVVKPFLAGVDSLWYAGGRLIASRDTKIKGENNTKTKKVTLQEILDALADYYNSPPGFNYFATDKCISLLCKIGREKLKEEGK